MKNLVLIMLVNVFVINVSLARTAVCTLHLRLDESSLQKVSFIGIGTLKTNNSKKYFSIEKNWKGNEDKIEIIPNVSKVGLDVPYYHSMEENSRYLVLYNGDIKNPITLNACKTYLVKFMDDKEEQEKTIYIQNILGKPKYIQKK